MGSVAASLLKFCVSVFITAIQFTRLSMLSVRVRWKIKFGARFTWAKKNPLRNSHKLCKEIFAVTFACIVLVLGKKLSKKKKLSHSSTQTFRLENAYSCISLSLVSPKGDPKYLVSSFGGTSILPDISNLLIPSRISMAHMADLPSPVLKVVG